MIKLGRIYKKKDSIDNPFIPVYAIPVKRLTGDEYRKLIEPHISYQEKSTFYLIWNVEHSFEEPGLWRQNIFLKNYEEVNEKENL